MRAFLEPLKVEKVAMEASICIIPMYRRLVDEGYNVIVSHPKKARYIAEARIKSDRVDSKARAVFSKKIRVNFNQWGNQFLERKNHSYHCLLYTSPSPRD